MRKVFKLFEAVLINTQLFILNKLIDGGIIMMAMFFAQRVILGKQTFESVPAKLKDQVREILIDSGLPELCEE